MSKRPVAEAFPVGDILADELEARGWTQAEFAEILGRPTQFVSEILGGKKEITRESASQIGAALGTSPELWLAMQDDYFLWEQSRDQRLQSDLGDVRTRARLSQIAPVAVLRRRGFLTSTRVADQVHELLALLGMRDLDDQSDLVPAARRSNADAALTTTQVAWVACVRAVARGLPVAAYDHDVLTDLAARLPRALVSPDDFVRLPGELAAAGVKLVFVEAFPGSKIDGCALVVDDVPTIGLSGRGHRLDKVLFTLMHEIAHVILGHIDRGVVIVDEEPDGSDIEGAADAQAAAWILPEGLPPAPQVVDASWVGRVAGAAGVAPIVVVGRLQKADLLGWRTSLVSGAPKVLDQLRAWRGPSAATA